MTEQDRGQTIRRKLAGMAEERAKASLPTGFAGIDRALGVGGWPRGQLVELFGPSSSGKTSLLLQSIAHAQRGGSAAAWIDADRCFDGAYAARLGVVMEKLPVVRPDSAEEAFGMLVQLVESGALDLVAVDSAAALVPEIELGMGIGEAGLSLRDRVLGSGLRRAAAAARRHDTCVVFLNQIRARRDSLGRETETSAGGPALKSYADVRIALAAKGRRVCVRVLKNRAAGAFREAELVWKPDEGFSEGL